MLNTYFFGTSKNVGSLGRNLNYLPDLCHDSYCIEDFLIQIIMLDIPFFWCFNRFMDYLFFIGLPLPCHKGGKQ